MIDVKQQVVEKLNEILPTYDEMFIDKSIQLPAISYNEYNNFDETDATGETFGYSILQYYIKLWGYKVADMTQTLKQIDSVMRKMGFKRITKSEMINDTQICYQALYEGRGIEDYE